MIIMMVVVVVVKKKKVGLLTIERDQIKQGNGRKDIPFGI